MTTRAANHRAIIRRMRSMPRSRPSPKARTVFKYLWLDLEAVGPAARVAHGVADTQRSPVSPFTPTVYAVAGASTAPSNLIPLLDAVPSYRKAGRKQMFTRMADPNTAGSKALLVAESGLGSSENLLF